ncbi:MAG: CHAT domain-containing protein [Bacteroidota bacterium]
MKRIFSHHYFRNNHLGRLTLVFGVIFLFSSPAISQSEDRIRALVASEVSKEEIVSNVDAFLTDLEAQKNDSLHYLYQIYAYWLYDEIGKKEAITYEKKALEFAKKRQHLDTSFAQRSAIFLAYYYVKDNQFLKSIDAYKEVIVIDNTSKHAITAYLKLGYSYFEIQDYYNALKYYKLAVSLLKKNNGSLQKLREAYQNIASTCLQIKTIPSIMEGRHYGQLADSLIETIPTSIENRYKIKYVLAQLHNRDEAVDFDKSLFYYDQANEIAKKEADTTKLITTYLGYGILYKHFNSDRSIEYLQEALNYTRPKDHYHTYQIYTSLGFNYDIKKDYAKSVSYRHQGLEYLTNLDFKDHRKSYDSLFLATNRKINLLHAIPRLGESYLRYFEATKDPALLEKSIAYFLMADKIIDQLKLNSREYRSRLFWRKISTGLYGKAIKACYLKNDPEMAFYFMEKNKALLLLEDISKQRFNESLGLDNRYLTKEEDLRKRIYQIEANLRESQLRTTSEKDSLQKLLVDSNIELSMHRDSLNITSKPFNIESKITTLADVQRQLSEDEMVLEYHISIDDGFGVYTNNDKGYVLAISKDKSTLFEIPNMDYVKDKTLLLLDQIKSPFRTTQDITNYATLSNSVYNLLFPSEELRAQMAQKRLTIIPDSYLSFLPFEALSTTSDRIAYLISQSTIQYQHSNSFLQNITQNEAVNNSYLSLVPGEFSIPELTPLRYSSDETESLQSLYSGTSFIGQSATKSNFLAQMENYGIIHLATHADARDANAPWIAFHDEKITLDELYLLQNEASLVVLSGCNTTLGKQEVGEGIMSLARGFFYGGARSVMSTLWSIDDKSTALITKDFYKNLSKGQTKSESLRNAKLSYLNSHSLSEASPYHWASFIVMGDNSPIKTSLPLWPFILVGVLVLAAILWIRMRRKSTP